MWNISYFEECW